MIGLPAMAAYHQAADLRTGFLIYPALGLGAPALSIALGIAFAFDPGAPTTAASLAYLAAALSAAHVFATTRAAPNLLQLRSGTPEEAVLAHVYRGFTRWQTVRAILQVAAFVAVVLALASLLPFGQCTKWGRMDPKPTDGNGRSTGTRLVSTEGRLWLPTDLFVQSL